MENTSSSWTAASDFDFDLDLENHPYMLTVDAPPREQQAQLLGTTLGMSPGSIEPHSLAYAQGLQITPSTLAQSPMLSSNLNQAWSVYAHSCNLRSAREKSELYSCTLCTSKNSSRTFKSRSDLQRHKKTVHRKLEKGNLMWKCAVRSCKDDCKLWPRLDNFRGHLRRVHRVNVDGDGDETPTVVGWTLRIEEELVL